MTERLVRIMIESIPQILVPGLIRTIPLTVVSFALSLVLAVIVAMIRIAKIPVLDQICRLYVWMIRGTPLLVQLYVIFYGLPRLGILIDPIPSAIIAFTVNTAAYDSETIRAAIESVPVTQIESAYCVGMNYLQAMWYVVLPQAFRTAFPTLFNSLIGLLKDTSLAANITVLEMLMATQRVIARTYEPFALYLEVGAFYLIFSTILTKLQAFGEKKLNRMYVEE